MEKKKITEIVHESRDGSAKKSGNKSRLATNVVGTGTSLLHSFWLPTYSDGLGKKLQCEYKSI